MGSPETPAPHLTSQRWRCLIALRENRVLQSRPFLPRELVIVGRGGHLRPCAGATMHSLREAGWVEQVSIGGTGEGMPFRAGGPATAWQITDAGRKAIAACPDTFPGESVYGGRDD